MYSSSLLSSTSDFCAQLASKLLTVTSFNSFDQNALALSTIAFLTKCDISKRLYYHSKLTSVMDDCIEIIAWIKW